MLRHRLTSELIMGKADIVDSGHHDRDCPYCGGRQAWITDPEGQFEAHYFHLDTNCQYCDEERLARWDMSESWKRS